MSEYIGRTTGMNIWIFPVVDEFTHRGYPVTGYKVQDTGTAIQTHSMRQDTDYRTVPVTHGEDSGRSVYNQDRSIFLHFRLETVGNGGEQSKVMTPDKRPSLGQLPVTLRQDRQVMLQS